MVAGYPAVKLSVIALDYDGTIAHDDVLEPSMRQAIAAARTSGIVTLLVTGRALMSSSAWLVHCTSSMA